MKWQIQSWPTPEIFINRTGRIWRDVATGALALSSLIVAQPVTNSQGDAATGALALSALIVVQQVTNSQGDAATGALALTSLIENQNIPFPQSGNDAATGALALSSIIQFSPVTNSQGDAATGALALTSLSTSGSPSLAAWLSQISTAGGATPSGGTQTAMNNFLNALSAASILTKIKSCNCFVPDNLIACLTPIISTVGNLTWTNHNFVTGDVSVNGLAGNGSNKYADTGVIPSAIFGGASGGMTVYVAVNPSSANSELDAGTSDSAGAQAMYLAATYGGGGSLWHYHNNVGGQGALGCAAIQNTGYFSGNRASAILSSLFFASSTQAHTTAGTIVTDGGSNPIHEHYSHAGNNGGVAFLFTHKTLSCLAIHDALNSSESAAFYTAIQTMRTALGGGFV